MRMHISYIYIYIYIATSLENLYKVLINIALGCRPSNKTKKKKKPKKLLFISVEKWEIHRNTNRTYANGYI